MAELFVSRSIEINTPPEKVWLVLTHPDFTKQWIGAFRAVGAIVSAWRYGDPVLWKGLDGRVLVKGTVTALEPQKLLRFTVFDIHMKKEPKVLETDGITYALTDKDGHTILSVVQGDFGKVENGELHYKATLAVWKKALPMIKQLAEATKQAGV
jgi:uncharacterized protein YndB with AHSA1/START domain